MRCSTDCAVSSIEDKGGVPVILFFGNQVYTRRLVAGLAWNNDFMFWCISTIKTIQG
jgi:hypothetical protein